MAAMVNIAAAARTSSVAAAPLSTAALRSTSAPASLAHAIGTTASSGLGITSRADNLGSGISPVVLEVGFTVFGRTTSAKKLVARRSLLVRAGVDLSKIVPQADRILLKLESLAETTSGGVLLPRSAVKFERYLVGEVVAVGSEVKNTEKGKKVMVSDINAYEVNLGTADKLCFAKAADLLAEVE